MQEFVTLYRYYQQLSLVWNYTFLFNILMLHREQGIKVIFR